MIRNELTKKAEHCFGLNFWKGLVPREPETFSVCHRMLEILERAEGREVLARWAGKRARERNK